MSRSPRAATSLEGRHSDERGRTEQLTGKLHFLIDPANKRNLVIADLDKAPKNAAGKIEMSADLVILRPRDASLGNGVALFDILNRGGSVVMNAFNGPIAATPEGEAGNGFLFTQGYTVIRVGWEFDARREGAIRIEVPGAVGVTGFARATFIPTSRNAEATVGDLVGYTPGNPAAPENTLKVREADGTWTTIPRARWQLGAANLVTLEGGFEPGRMYKLAYSAANPPIAGLGYAAIRDAAAWVRYAADATVSARYAYAYGSSQTGRWLRDFLYEGFNTDERNRAVFDAVIPHIAGGSGIDLNRRWSTPTSLSMETAMHFPFSDKKQRDPVTGVEEGLLENARASEHQPKIFLTSSSTEYWERSLALVHTTPDGSKDVAPPENVRLYAFASAPHNVGRFPPAVTNGQVADNPLDYPLALRALLVAMDNWVRKGVTPPPSRYPRLQDSTLVRSTDVSFPNIPGVASPRKVAPGTRGPNRLLPKDGGAGAPLPLLVPQMDKDGNELSGIRFPQVTVPLATFTGWNFRKTEIGGPDQLFPLQGGYIPFAKTKAEREQAHDPRLSIEERYQSREMYLKLVQDAGGTLVKDGYLLAEDLPKVVQRAEEHWDFLVRRPAGALTQAAR